MSHTVKVATQFKKYDLFKKALEKFGWKVEQNSKIRTYPSDPQRDKVYTYIGKNPISGYDFGFDVENGEVTGIHYDPYDGTIHKSLGDKFAKLKTEYAMTVARDLYEDVQVTEETDEYIMIEAEDGE
jgi:hypothetical protein